MNNYDRLHGLADTNMAADDIITLIAEVCNGGFNQLLKSNMLRTFKDAMNVLGSLSGEAIGELHSRGASVSSKLTQLSAQWKRIDHSNDSPRTDAAVRSWEKQLEQVVGPIEAWMFDENNVERLCGEVFAALNRPESPDRVVESLLASCPA